MPTPKSNFRMPQWIIEEIKRRTSNMTKYVIDALIEKFERDDKRKDLQSNKYFNNIYDPK